MITFKINASNNEDNNFDNIIQQNNYTNCYLRQTGTYLHKLKILLNHRLVQHSLLQRRLSFVLHELHKIPTLFSKGNMEKLENLLDKNNDTHSKLSLSKPSNIINILNKTEKSDSASEYNDLFSLL